MFFLAKFFAVGSANALHTITAQVSNASAPVRGLVADVRFACCDIVTDTMPLLSYKGLRVAYAWSSYVGVHWRTDVLRCLPLYVVCWFCCPRAYFDSTVSASADRWFAAFVLFCLRAVGDFAHFGTRRDLRLLWCC
jgi:hypothetical protein